MLNQSFTFTLCAGVAPSEMQSLAESSQSFSWSIQVQLPQLFVPQTQQGQNVKNVLSVSGFFADLITCNLHFRHSLLFRS